METHLRKITRCLGRAVNELERVSASDKIAREVDAEWMATFHAEMNIPVPLETSCDARSGQLSDSNAWDRSGEGKADLRWAVLKSTWLPLLRDLYRTVGALDLEESELQEAEKRKEQEKEKGQQPQEKGEGKEEDENKDRLSRNMRKINQAPPRPPKGLLSLRDYTVIHAALEILVHWGLVPVLEPGVGVFDLDKRPRSRAVKISGRVLHFWGTGSQRLSLPLSYPPSTSQASHHDASLMASSCATASSAATAAVGGDAGSWSSSGAYFDTNSAERITHAQLAVCTEVIQGVVTTEQFMPMLMPLYLPDLLAARLQLVYVPRTPATATAVDTVKTPLMDHVGDKQSTATTDRQSNNTALIRSCTNGVISKVDPPATSSSTASGLAKRENLASLRAILKDVGPRQVMGALRHLLSQGARAPLWLRHSAGRILSEIVLRPGGVQATLEVYVAGAATSSGEEGGEGDEMKACLRVSKILATPPKRVGPGGYVKRIAPQLAEMLHFDGHQKAIITRVVVMIIGKLSESMPVDTKRLVLYPLLRPLLLFWGPHGSRRGHNYHHNRSSRSGNSSPLASTADPLPERSSKETRRLKEEQRTLKENQRATKDKQLTTGKNQRTTAEQQTLQLSLPAVPRTATKTTTVEAAKIETIKRVSGVADDAVGGEAAAMVSEGSCVSVDEEEESQQERGGNGRSSSTIGGDVLSEEEALGRCLEDLEKLLTAAPAPSALLGLLSSMGVAVPLFRLHCFCKTSKSLNLQSTKASLSALLPSSPTAAADLVAGLLPIKTDWRHAENPIFSPGPTGGAVLRTASPPRSNIYSSSSKSSTSAGSVSTAKVGLSCQPSPSPTTTDDNKSLLDLEAALEGLGLDPETLRLVESAAGVENEGGEGGAGAGLMDALAGLKEAEGKARDVAEVLEGLGEGSSVAGKVNVTLALFGLVDKLFGEVFELLLRRYLSIKDGNGTPGGISTGTPRPVTTTTAAAAAVGEPGLLPKTVNKKERPAEPSPTSTFATAAEEHAVMASVIVLAERLGARVFGTGMQILSCIRLVLEHEQHEQQQRRLPAGGGRNDDHHPVISDGCESAAGLGLGVVGDRYYVDAAARVARMEKEQEGAASAESLGEGVMGSEIELEREEEGEGDTLCSVVLALLTTVLELGEEDRPAEEETELRAMLGPLKSLAAGHRNAEVAEMSTLLCASIISRDLTPEQRRKEKERVKNGTPDGSSNIKGGKEARTATMMSALDAAEEDLKSEAVPLRARGVVTLTRVMRATVETGDGGSGAGVNMDTAVTQRLMDTYARMTGDTNSYVYLAAVQGLTALADALPGWCIPRLVGLFTASSSSSSPAVAAVGLAQAAASDMPPALSLSQRLKIGEAVLLSARRCGETMPKYAHFYVNAFVAASRERATHQKEGAENGASPGRSSAAAVRKTAREKTPPSPLFDQGSCINSSGSSRQQRRDNSGSRKPRRGEESDAHKRVEESMGRTKKATLGGGGGGLQGQEQEELKAPPQARALVLESKERYHFRASCLSNLAEVCQLLRWSLGRFSQDIVDLGVGVLSMETGDSEEATLVRRGAAFLLGRLLRGAGGDVLQIVPTAELRAAYRALKRSAESDRDEITRSHARNGLGYLDLTLRGQLFPTSGSGGDSMRARTMAGAGVGAGEAEKNSRDPSSGHHPGIIVL